MSKEYVFQHYVQSHYLESWANNKGLLKVFDTVNNKFFFTSHKSVLGENDYYTLSTDTILALDKQDKSKIFEELDKYMIEFEGKTLKTVNEYARYYYEFENWQISDEDGIISETKSIKELIDKKRIVDIELGWHPIEGEWSKIKREVIKAARENTYNLDINILKKLVEYIVSQKSRTNMKKDEYKEIINDLIGFSKENMSDEEYNVLIDEFGETYFLKSIRKYQENELDSIISLEEEKTRELYCVIYKSINGNKFFTSDNPAFNIINYEFYKGQYNGLYFPIIPEILIGLYRGDSYSYHIEEMSSDMVEEFNKKIINNCKRFYVKPN